jgi:hypothetical protein
VKQFVVSVILILAFGIVSFAQEDMRIADPVPFDSFGKLSLNDQEGRFDNFFAFLSKAESSKGILVLELNKNESKSKKDKRLKEISRHFDLRKIDKSRIAFAVYQNDTEFTKLRLIPKIKDATDLYDESEGYKIIRGEEFEQKIKELFAKK